MTVRLLLCGVLLMIAACATTPREDPATKTPAPAVESRPPATFEPLEKKPARTKQSPGEAFPLPLPTKPPATTGGTGG